MDWKPILPKYFWFELIVDKLRIACIPNSAKEWGWAEDEEVYKCIWIRCNNIGTALNVRISVFITLPMDNRAVSCAAYVCVSSSVLNNNNVMTNNSLKWRSLLILLLPPPSFLIGDLGANCFLILLFMNNCNKDAAAPRTRACTWWCDNTKRNNNSGKFIWTISITSAILARISNQLNWMEEIHSWLNRSGDADWDWGREEAGNACNPWSNAMFRVELVGETAPNSILFLDGLRPP